jgi:hypothetical protein
MRALLLVLVLLVAVAAAMPARSLAQAAPRAGGSPTAEATQQGAPDDDDTVAVQLVVLGVAVFTVVGIGLSGYLLRRRLGLVPPPPGPDAGAHH